MDRDSPASRTALGAARHRAVHQLIEGGSILADPLAVRVVGEDPEALVARAQQRADDRMRWFVCARSRFAEQVLAEAVADGVEQLVVLGAGLDTFGYRNPHTGLRVVELDHPATQEWKLERLAAAGIEVPDTVVHAPIDFERQELMDVLGAHVDLDRPVLCWWLGVTPYLTREAIEATLMRIGSLASAAVVLDHAVPTPEDVDPAEAELGRRRRERVARLGEPWISAFAYPELAGLAQHAGFTDVRPEDEGALIRRCLGLPPPDSHGPARPSHLLVATRGWPAAGAQPRR